MFLSLLLGGAALLVGGKLADEALKNMDPEDFEKLKETASCIGDVLRTEGDDTLSNYTKDIEIKKRIETTKHRHNILENEKRQRIREEEKQLKDNNRIKFNLKPEDYKLFKKHVGYKNFNYRFIEEIREYRIKISELKINEAICKIEDEMYYCKDNDILLEMESVLNILYNEL